MIAFRIILDVSKNSDSLDQWVGASDPLLGNLHFFLEEELRFDILLLDLQSSLLSIMSTPLEVVHGIDTFLLILLLLVSLLDFALELWSHIFVN